MQIERPFPVRDLPSTIKRRGIQYVSSDLCPESLCPPLIDLITVAMSFIQKEKKPHNEKELREKSKVSVIVRDRESGNIYELVDTNPSDFFIESGYDKRIALQKGLLIIPYLHTREGNIRIKAQELAIELPRDPELVHGNKIGKARFLKPRGARKVIRELRTATPYVLLI